MKKSLFIVFFSIFNYLAFAQSPVLTEKEGKIYNGDQLYSGIQEISNDGFTKSIFTIKEGVKDGKVTHFYPTKAKKEIGKYANDKKHGLWEKWDEKGNKISEAHYKGGLKTGTWVVWDHKGIKRYEMHYEAGNKSGIWKIWNDSGVLTQEKEF